MFAPLHIQTKERCKYTVHAVQKAAGTRQQFASTDFHAVVIRAYGFR